MDVPAPPSPPGRAGRNLPVAIAVGVALGAAVLGTLFTIKPLFLVVVALGVGMGLWELCAAMVGHDMHPPFLPLAAGLGATIALAYVRGADGMMVAALLTAVAVIVWRLAEGAPGLLSDLGAALFALTYVVILAGFAVLLVAAKHDGAQRETTFIATVVCSDVGGYATGVLFGRHPLAPSISPKKSWEGLAGSLLFCAVAGWLFLRFFFHQPWWHGVLVGLALAASATLGDLGESMLKRDIGVKDMGRLLPGHGGVMDRLDSLLPSAPVAWLLITALAPVHHH